MAVQHTSFVLKVLNGFNAGAVVRLKTGSLVVGSSMSSDIILHDDNIAGQHIQLLITPGSITLQPLARPVFVDGVEVTGESVDLRAYQTVRLGKVELQVADSRVAAPRPSASGKAGAAAAASVKKSATTAKPPPSPPPAARQAIPEHRQPVSKGWSGKTWLALGLGLLLLANLIYWSPRLNHWLEMLGVVESPERRAAALLEELGQRDFKLVDEADGSVRVEGYTSTVEERNKLLGRLQAADVNARLHIWAQDDMAENANMVCRAMGEPKIIIKSGETGSELRAEGFVSKSVVWERIRASILNDVGGVVHVKDDKLQSMDGYLAAFMQFIEKKGLSSRIKATTDGKSVIVNGEVTQPEIELLKTLRQEFVEKEGKGPPIELKVTDIRDRIILAIRSVSVGKVPFLVAKDGKKYMEGSTLGEKYFIKAIKPDHVVLTNNGVEIPFYYGIDKGKRDADSRREP